MKSGRNPPVRSAEEAILNPSRNKVCLVNTHGYDGGAARACLRLLRALRGAGVDAQLACQFAGHQEPGVVGPASRLGKVMAHAGRLYEDSVAKRQGSAGLFSPATRTWGNLPDGALDNILHLHWVQKGFLSIESIGRLPPFFWTFHDMWPLTAGLHYSDDPTPGVWRAMEPSVWRRKVRAWDRLDVSVIAPSHWMAENARRSPLFQGRPITVIPNAIDTDFFHPVEKGWARSLLGIEPGKKVLLFGAMDATSDPRKGFDLLVRALDGWTAKRDVHLLIVGATTAPGLSESGYSWTGLGHLSDDLSLVVAYNAADAVVVPSRQENLSNMLLEAMACGVPCVGFDLGGNSDAIVPGRTGDLAEPEDARSLREALDRVLFAGPSRDAWGSAARDFAVERFAPAVVARQHLALYKTIEDKP